MRMMCFVITSSAGCLSRELGVVTALSIVSCLSSLLKESEGCKEIIDKPPFPRDNIHCGLRRRSYRQLKVILRNHIYVFFSLSFFLQSQAVKS